MADNDVYVVSALRTPIGSFNGSLSTLKADELGAIVIIQSLNQTKIDPTEISEVILGQVLPAGQGQNPARQASINAGIPKEVPACGVNIICGSGLKAIIHGYQSIKLGDSKIVVAGGQESMSLSPHVMHLRNGTRLGDGSLKDTILSDALVDAFHGIHMGITAENVAKQYGVSRREQDELAAESQRRATNAQINGYFEEEIVPIKVQVRRETVTVSKDEYVKPGTTLDSLSKLKPCFLTDGTGTVTAGNASGINDGAAVVILVSGAELQKKGLKPLAKVVSWAHAGCDPSIMGMGPVEAVREAVRKAGWTLDQVDLFELNEAFASVSVALSKELGLNPNKVNVNGGAIALGHPVGCSGARVAVTLIHELRRSGKSKGLAALCVGGGQGVAMCVEIPK